jgi:general secretion pathway protein L
MSARTSRLAAGLAACQQRLRSLWQTAGGETAWRWWSAELFAMLPSFARRRLAAATAETKIDWPLGEIVEVKADATLVLPHACVLTQVVRLPQIAGSNAATVIKYELDRYSPYPASDLSYAVQVISVRNTVAEIRWVAIPTQRLHTILQVCRDRGFEPRGIDARDEKGVALGVDLMPGSARTSTPGGTRIDRCLLATCLVSVFVLLNLWLAHRQNLLDTMQAAVELQHSEVAALRELRQELDSTQGAASYLRQKRIELAAVSTVLSDLATCMPVDTSLDKLEINDQGEVTMAGQSARASVLIGAMAECRTLEKTRFDGVIRADERTAKDNFNVKAHLRQETVDAQTTD